ncbi:MAG: hypothetical protein WDZ79_02175 [Candidatus Paceibacterota bacterium]
MKKIWTVEKIKYGFDTFMQKHGRLPKAAEIDELSYLPSSRWIQLTYGGLEYLRAHLGYEDSHFGKGSFRSAIANRVNLRGRTAERELEKQLNKKFGEVFVHTEKIFDMSKNRVDFYIYTPDGNFGIDIFHPDTMKTLQSKVNIEINKYSRFSDQLFLVVANTHFKQKELDEYANLKTRPLAKKVRLITLTTLMQIIEGKKTYPNPLSCTDRY